MMQVGQEEALVQTKKEGKRESKDLSRAERRKKSSKISFLRLDGLNRTIVSANVVYVGANKL